MRIGADVSGSAVQPDTWMAFGCRRATSTLPTGYPNATRGLTFTMSWEMIASPAFPGHAVPSPDTLPASRWPMIGLRIAPRNATGTNGLIWWIDIFHAIRLLSALNVADVGGTLLWSPIIAMPTVPVLKLVAWAPITPWVAPPYRPS